MLELILGLFLVSSTFGAVLSKSNDERRGFRSSRKHTKPLILDKDTTSRY